MGLDYSYITIFKKADKQKLTSRLSLDATINKTDFGMCSTINFKVDKSILEYLKSIIRQNEGINLRTTLFFKKSRFKDYFSGDFGKIGCVYIEEKVFPNTNYIFVSFSAATTSMSILFQNSASIKEWFISLSKEVNAVATFLDLEDNGYRFIYKNGQEVDIAFPRDGEQLSPEQDFYKKICDEYKKATYI